MAFCHNCNSVKYYTLSCYSNMARVVQRRQFSCCWYRRNKENNKFRLLLHFFIFYFSTQLAITVWSSFNYRCQECLNASYTRCIQCLKKKMLHEINYTRKPPEIQNDPTRLRKKTNEEILCVGCDRSRVICCYEISKCKYSGFRFDWNWMVNKTCRSFWIV